MAILENEDIEEMQEGNSEDLCVGFHTVLALLSWLGGSLFILGCFYTTGMCV